MRTLITLCAASLIALMTLTGCIPSEPAAPKVAVVDTARVFRDSEPGKAGVKFLEGMQEGMQRELNSLQDQLQKKPEDAALQQKLQETYMSLQQRMGAEQQNVITLLNDAIQRAMDSYRARKQLDVILTNEAALSYSKAVDVTADIIAEFNTHKLTFTPVIPEDSKETAKEAAPAKPEPAPKAEEAPAKATDATPKKADPAPQKAPK